jgi:hypothetical protein
LCGGTSRAAQKKGPCSHRQAAIGTHADMIGDGPIIPARWAARAGGDATCDGHGSAGGITRAFARRSVFTICETRAPRTCCLARGATRGAWRRSRSTSATAQSRSPRSATRTFYRTRCDARQRPPMWLPNRPKNRPKGRRN